jgi:hypothetical protein
MSWKYTASSVTGRTHLDRNEPGQDFCRAGAVQVSDREFFIGLVADGAGSTRCGGEGAKTACDTAFGSIVKTIRTAAGEIHPITDGDVRGWVCSARDAIVAQAAASGAPVREYACTLIGSVVGGGQAIFFQIGDGAIVMKEGDEYRVVFWPDQGEYANSTFFVSDESFLNHLEISRKDFLLEEVALFTDGLQNLVLSFSKKAAHDGFFRPLFAAVRAHSGNRLPDLSAKLDGFLSRSEVNERTDDDKTLVLAVHAP